MKVNLFVFIFLKCLFNKISKFCLCNVSAQFANFAIDIFLLIFIRQSYVFKNQV